MASAAGGARNCSPVDSRRNDSSSWSTADDGDMPRSWQFKPDILYLPSRPRLQHCVANFFLSVFLSHILLETSILFVYILGKTLNGRLEFIQVVVTLLCCRW